MKGYVKWFNNKLGYGFIKSEEIDKDIFIHYSEINKKGYKKLNENDIILIRINSSYSIEKENFSTIFLAFFPQQINTSILFFTTSFPTFS